MDRVDNTPGPPPPLVDRAAPEGAGTDGAAAFEVDPWERCRAVRHSGPCRRSRTLMLLSVRGARRPPAHDGAGAREGERAQYPRTGRGCARRGTDPPPPGREGVSIAVFRSR